MSLKIKKAEHSACDNYFSYHVLKYVLYTYSYVFTGVQYNLIQILTIHKSLLYLQIIDSQYFYNDGQYFLFRPEPIWLTSKKTKNLKIT